MAMTILNNTATMMGLGELNKNITKVGKDLRKLAKGEAITGAGDNASGFAISEKMRELILSLRQNERNVQTGTNLLKVAEGGVQEQLEIMKLIKQKVIDAANDTNTDTDRAIIQKEIDQSFKQIEDIAQTTNYNGKRLLAGDVTDIHTEMKPTPVKHMVLQQDAPIWRTLDKAVALEDSDAGLIADVYETLDNMTEEGPFDVFERIKSASSPIEISTLGLPASSEYFSGGIDGDPKTISYDLATNYNSPADLDGVGFSLGNTKYVFSTNPSKEYSDSYNVIDISGANNMADVANILSNTLNYDYDIEVSGSKLTFSTKDNSHLASAINNQPGLTGISSPATSKTETIPSQPTYGTTTVTKNIKSIPNLPSVFSGGKNGRNPTYETKTELKRDPSDPDRWISNKTEVITDPGEPGTPAKTTVNLSAAEEGTCLKLHGKDGKEAYLYFKEGNDELILEGETSSGIKVYTVGLNNRSASSTMAKETGIRLNMRNFPSVTFESYDLYNGALPNNSWYVDNVPTSSVAYDKKEITGYTPEQTIIHNYSAVTALNTDGTNTVNSQKDAVYATYDMNFSNLNDVESIIDDLYGKSLNFNLGSDFSFIDKGKLNDGSGLMFGLNAKKLDLNEFRQLAKTEGNNLKALQKFLSQNISPNTVTTTSTGIKIQALNIGAPGNSEALWGSDSGVYRHYDVDFSDKNPSDLIGKGFRVYCGTDESEWWNFEFTGKQDADFEAERPIKGDDATSKIKTFRIDISGAKNGKDIAKITYEHCADKLAHEWDHNLRIEANPNTGILTLYDKRSTQLTHSEGYDTLMGKGGPDDNVGWWKIADGIIDDVEEYRGEKWVEKEVVEEVPTKVFSKDFVIHDGPHAQLRIFLKLPQTTLDKVLDFDKSEHSYEEFNVMSKDMRDKLLGFRTVSQGDEPEETGILDKGITYLTDSQILIGSEIQRLNMSEANIVNKIETATASESVIRDADMAKEMTSFAKNNVLAQASQAMLAQANQNLSGVLGLLQ